MYSSFVSAESSFVSAESSFVSAESSFVSAESSFVSAESSFVSSESSFVSADSLMRVASLAENPGTDHQSWQECLAIDFFPTLCHQKFYVDAIQQ
jgi:hypothetical protein